MTKEEWLHKLRYSYMEYSTLLLSDKDCKELYYFLLDKDDAKSTTPHQ